MGGYNIKERLRCIEELKSFESAGYVIDGFHSNGVSAANLSWEEVEPVLKSTLVSLIKNCYRAPHRLKNEIFYFIERASRPSSACVSWGCNASCTHQTSGNRDWYIWCDFSLACYRKRWSTYFPQLIIGAYWVKTAIFFSRIFNFYHNFYYD